MFFRGGSKSFKKQRRATKIARLFLIRCLPKPTELSITAFWRGDDTSSQAGADSVLPTESFRMLFLFFKWRAVFTTSDAVLDPGFF